MKITNNKQLSIFSIFILLLGILIFKAGLLTLIQIPIVGLLIMLIGTALIWQSLNIFVQNINTFKQ